jgi:hypothetical protein
MWAWTIAGRSEVSFGEAERRDAGSFPPQAASAEVENSSECGTTRHHPSMPARSAGRLDIHARSMLDVGDLRITDVRCTTHASGWSSGLRDALAPERLCVRDD